MILRNSTSLTEPIGPTRPARPPPPSRSFLTTRSTEACGFPEILTTWCGQWSIPNSNLSSYQCCTQVHAKNYTQQLEAKGRFKLCIWPEHCLVCLSLWSADGVRSDVTNACAYNTDWHSWPRRRARSEYGSTELGRNQSQTHQLCPQRHEL